MRKSPAPSLATSSDNSSMLAALPVWQQTREGGRILRVWAKPGAKQAAILGTKADAQGHAWLQVAVKAAAIDGKANDALIAFLAQTLDVRRSAITLIQGEKSRQKLFFIGKS